MKIEIELTGFTPVLDNLIQEYDLVTAAIYGIVWRYAQMSDKVCKAPLKKIGKRLDLSGKTAERHIKKLCIDGYLVDLTPGVRNTPHSYAVTGKAEMSGAIVARSDRESDQGQTESLTRSDRESDQGQTESPLKIHDKKQTKIPQQPSANADYNRPISLLSEKEIKELKLPLSTWKEYLIDEQAERGRKGVIKFLETKIAIGPLLPDTPEAHFLFGRLAVEAEAKGRNPPQKFPTLACKDKFNTAASKLNGTLEEAVNSGLETGITAIPRLVNYISSPKWKEGKNGRTRAQDYRGGQSSITRNTQDDFEPGNGRTPEMQAKLEAAFAIKPG